MTLLVIVVLLAMELEPPFFHGTALQFEIVTVFTDLLAAVYTFSASRIMIELLAVHLYPALCHYAALLLEIEDFAVNSLLTVGAMAVIRIEI